MNRMDYALSDTDIRRYLPHANILPYTIFSQMVRDGATLDDVVGRSGVCILLYEVRRGVGHWTAIIKRGDGVECFDSLGYAPDDQFKFVPTSFLQPSGQNHSYLIRLLYDSGLPVEYNEKKLQKNKKGVNTCGRWCVFRVACRDWSLKQFQDFFKGMDGDNFLCHIVK